MRIYNANPYNWIITSIIQLVSIIYMMMNLSAYPTWVIGFIMVVILFIGYFIIPKQMKFKLALTINKSGMIIENEDTIDWQDVLSILKKGNQFEIKYKKADTTKTTTINLDNLFVSEKRLVAEFNKHTFVDQLN